MADIPESTKSEHVVWTVDATSYLRNLDSEDLGAETIAVHHQSAPEKTETGTRISLRFPTLIVSGYCSEPREVAHRVARILNAHWDEPAAPPAMDREAVERTARKLLRDAVAKRDDTGASLAKHDDQCEVDVGAAIDEIFAALSTLSADAIRQGEGSEFERDVTYEVWQDDEPVAGSTNEADARHYLEVYGQDGPAKLMRVVTIRTEIATTPASDGGKA